MKKKIIIYTIAATFLPILYFWWQGNGISAFSDAASFFTGIGKLFGLLAVYGILLQFLLMSRTRWLEQTFGLDKLARLHRTNGKLSIFFIVLHPIFITTGYAISSKTDVIKQFLSFLTDYDDLLNALIAVILFFVIVGLSLTIVRRKLKYEWWYFVHLFTYLAIILAWGHQLELGSDFISKPFVIYWYALYIIVFSNTLIFRFTLPIYKTWKHKFTVAQIVRENNNATSIYIFGQNLESFQIQPGQFIMWRFLAKGFWYESHPFSVSALPRSNQFRLTVKNSGDFTAKISTLPVGTKVFVDGPYGVFTPKSASRSKLLLIAGGIGITPIKALAEYFAHAKKDIVVLYANATAADVVFKKEFDQLAQKYNIPIIYIYSQDAKAAGIHGRLSTQMLKDLVKDITDREVFLCGPIPMMKAVDYSLQELGIAKKYIHYEEFAL